MSYRRFLLPFALLILLGIIANTVLRLHLDTATLIPVYISGLTTAEERGQILQECHLARSNFNNGQYTVTCGGLSSEVKSSVLSCQRNENLPTRSPGGYECPLRLEKASVSCTETEEEFLKLMETRRERVKTACSRPELFPNKKPAKEMFFFDQVGRRGLQWCPVFKAGSSSTNNYFCPLYYSNEDCDTTDHHKNTAGLWRNDNHLRNRFLEPAATAAKESPSLLIVRDPFERVLSAYRDKIQTPDPQESFLAWSFEKIMGPFRFVRRDQQVARDRLLRSAKDQTSTYLRANPGHRSESIFLGGDNPYLNPLSPTFPEFITALLLGFDNPHWIPVNTYCSPCTEEYHYILHSESYDCEFNALLQAEGAVELEGVIEEEGWAKHNKNPARQGESRAEFYEYYSQLSDQQLERLAERYRADCEMGGYECERTVCEIKRWRARHVAVLAT